MTYSANANPNATNSELDSKRIITHKELTSPQKDELIDQYVDIVVDNMSEESLILYAQEQLKSYYAKCNHYDLIEDINEYDPELYDELIDNVTSLNDNEEPWLQPLFLSNLSQIGQEQVNGANILCALIVNQSAKFITLVGQQYNALNVKNVLTNYTGA